MKNIGEFWSLPKGTAENPKLSPVDKLVFAILWTRRNGENESWPSQGNMAKQLSVSRRSVIRSLIRLILLGYIRCKKSGKGVTKVYIILWPTCAKMSQPPVPKCHTKITSEENIKKRREILKKFKRDLIKKKSI